MQGTESRARSLLEAIAVAMLVVAVAASLLGCHGKTQESSSPRTPSTIGTGSGVDLHAIPDDWRGHVTRSLGQIPIPDGIRLFAIVERLPLGSHRDSIEFSLHEDGPDAAPRFGTYKLDRAGNLFELNLLNEDESDLWTPIAGP